MKSIILPTLLLALCTSLANAQAPDTLWTKKYGGSDYENGYSVQQTSDSSYVIVGRTSSFGSGLEDVYFIKTNANGDTLWTKTYGGIDYDAGRAVQQTTDGGYIIAGRTSSSGAGSADVYLIKTNADGDTLWTRTYGGADGDDGYSVQQISDSGYIIAGITYSFGFWPDVYLIKTDSLGDTLWTRTYGGVDIDEGYSVQETIDGGYIIAGNTFIPGPNLLDVFLIKTDANGDTLWTRTYGGTEIDGSYSAQQTTDGGYIITGYTESFGAGRSDVWLLKTDSLGDTTWTKTYGGTLDDEGRSVQQTNDGGYIISGITSSFGIGSNDVYIIKTDVNGNALWTKTYGGIDDDRAFSAKQTSDKGYIIAGYTYSFGAGNADVYLIKIAPDTLGIKGHGVPVIRDDDFGATVFSGPLQLPEDKKCKVFDITGRVVLPDKIKPGIYFIEVDGVITKKVVKVR